jgi:glycosyltransferase involved in cell wall biosynthesis
MVEHFNSETIPASDIIVGTYWPTVKAAYEAGKGVVIHFCQGYEGDYKELANLKSDIDEVYSYTIPKITVSHHLNRFLYERFNAETYYIGQMLNRDFFYPASKSDTAIGPASTTLFEKIAHPFSVFRRNKYLSFLKIIVVGPFEVDFKNIPVALKGIAIAKNIWNLPIKLIRVSQFPLSAGEMKKIEPDEYHFRIPHQGMGELYRSADLFISMSKEAEGFGLPALEAMACGVPTILSKISSYCSFDEMPDYAVFADPPTPEMVAIAIKRITSEASLRRHLIERGIVVAGQFTKERVLQRLTDAFGKILHGT